MNREKLSTIGLIFITFMAAIQYVFLQNVPDSVSTFSFLCVTNAIGFILLGIVRFGKIRMIQWKTIKKGTFFAVLLTGFNFFMLLGSRHLDAVMISSLVSLYFVFITPLLLLLKKKVNFFSGIATVIAVIALLLMFGADVNSLFQSKDVIYLILADIFFAGYVVSVSLMGSDEDSVQLSFAQMFCSTVFGLIGWIVESMTGHVELSLPTDYSFWISAVFIGIFIRVIYGVIQIAAQKHVSALKASLIFASEIIITLVTNPLMCSIFHMEYVKATRFQVIGCIFFIISTLVIDETIMERLGYEDLKETTYIDENGQEQERSSVARKMIFTTLTFSMVTLILCTLICLSAISFIRISAVSNSKKLGDEAAETSMTAMLGEINTSISNQAQDKAALADDKLKSYSNNVIYSASYAEALFRNSAFYPSREVERPLQINAGKWAMQRALANESISYDALREESELLGNMLDVWEPIIRQNRNIATIYMGMEDGLLISYDPFSGSGEAEGESYYEYRDSEWYHLGKSADGYAFTETYQDGYGRGLTITCVAPVKDKNGRFIGCVAMDILMKELNESMVNDGIVDPSAATLIDSEGNVIAGRNVDPEAEELGNIFDEGTDDILYLVGKEILDRKKGIVSTGEDEGAYYIAYATIQSTDWTICIISPASTVTEPAVVIRDSIDQNTDNVVQSVVKGIITVIQSCLVVSGLILLLVTFMAGRMSKRISDPLKRLEADVRQISGGNLDRRTEVLTDDEIGSLAQSFNHMTDSLQKYIENIKEVTAERERIGAEVEIATRIQQGMLEHVAPDFVGKTEYDMFASMSPAREVGGDFYDFFMLDDDHIAILIADVSDKGVGSAFFMAIAKTLIKTYAKAGGTPAQILEKVDQHISEKNEAGLFVTVWFAVIDLVSGHVTACNAGHDYPAIMRAGEDFVIEKTPHGPPVAFIPGLPFKGIEFDLTPGSRIFLYTDGLNEAKRGDGERFGTERLLEVLNAHKDADNETMLGIMREEVDRFAGDEPQFDDMTMLGFTFLGKKG